MDAVAKGYLKNMYFGIAQDAAATNLLEVRGLGEGGSCLCMQHARLLLPTWLQGD